MDFKFFTENAQLMKKDSIEPLHKLIFKDEGSSHFARLMNKLESVNSCVYCYMKEEKGSGIHVISGTYRYGFSNLNVEFTCNWNHGVPNFELMLWPREESDHKVIKILEVKDILSHQKLDEQILSLVKENLPEITLLDTKFSV